MWCFIIDSAYVRPRPEKSTCECKGNLLTHPRAFRPFQDRIAIWKCWFLRCGENRSIRRKTSQPTYDAGSVNRTRDTLMGGKRSHYCAIPATPSQSWYLLGILFKISDKHPLSFYMGAPFPDRSWFSHNIWLLAFRYYKRSLVNRAKHFAAKMSTF